MGALHPVERKFKAKDLAKKWDVCERTVRRYIATPRAEYEANSISRTKPWEALAISRTTWYRQGKPTAPTGSLENTNRNSVQKV
jgi:hypothetical protein